MLRSTGPAARAFGPTGLGISVGVISDSINQSHGGIAASQATGDLPASVVALSDKPGGTDEGRAMAEIVYDEAPGISGIVFATANGGPAAKAAAIDALVSHGVKVIADDTSYITEPFFQDDVIAQAVDRARAAGVAYFIAAGNDGQQSWEGAFNGGASEDFDPGPATDTVQAVGFLPSGQTATLVLQWAEPWGHATDDFALDLYRINGAGQTLLATYDTNNIATGIPEEVAPISFSGNPRTYGIGIRRIAGTGTPLLKFIDFTNGAGTVTIEHPTNSTAISPDAASASGALTVAASRYSTPTTPESYSARGPVTRYFDAAGNALPVPDVRAKPSLAAPDGVATSVFGFGSFSGTSAAAPAAAGIAALILSAKPLMSVDVLYAIMTNPANALDCTLDRRRSRPRLRQRLRARRPGARHGARRHAAGRHAGDLAGRSRRLESVVPRTRDGELEHLRPRVARQRRKRLHARGARGRRDDDGDVHGDERRRLDDEHRHAEARLDAADRTRDRGHCGQDLHAACASAGRRDRVPRDRSDLRHRQLYRDGLRRGHRAAQADRRRAQRCRSDDDLVAHLRRRQAGRHLAARARTRASRSPGSCARGRRSSCASPHRGRASPCRSSRASARA